jgi:hypothetical protein
MSKSTTSPSLNPARPTPHVFMIVIASARAVSVETSKSSLGQDDARVERRREDRGNGREGAGCANGAHRAERRRDHASGTGHGQPR